MAFKERYVDFFHKGTSVCFFEGLPGFIWDLFFQTIYLFTEDLSAVSVFQSTHTDTLPRSHSPSPAPSLRLHSPEELCGIDFKIYEDLLKNPNKSQKNKS